MDEEALSWFVDNELSRKLLAVPGVGAVNRVGGVTREIRVALDPLRIQALGTTAADISRQLRHNKVRALESGAPEEILTANIGCLTHVQSGTRLPVRHWIELLDERL